MNVEQLIKLPYHVQLVHDESSDGQVGWVANVVELPGCLAQGDTPEDASRNIYAAMESWFASMLEDGKPIPPPAEEPSASGRVLLRLPASLHERLAFEARQEGVSLNQLLVGLLAGAVGWRTGAAPTTERATGRRAS